MSPEVGLLLAAWCAINVLALVLLWARRSRRARERQSTAALDSAVRAVVADAYTDAGKPDAPSPILRLVEDADREDRGARPMLAAPGNASPRFSERGVGTTNPSGRGPVARRLIAVPGGRRAPAARGSDAAGRNHR